MAKLTVSIDSLPLCDAIRDFSLLLADLPECAKGVIPSLIEAGHIGSKLVIVESNDLAASSTGELLLTLKPSEAFLSLMAAVRAGKLDLGVVENLFGHNSDSVGLVGATNVARRGDCDHA